MSSPPQQGRGVTRSLQWLATSSANSAGAVPVPWNCTLFAQSHREDRRRSLAKLSSGTRLPSPPSGSAERAGCVLINDALMARSSRTSPALCLQPSCGGSGPDAIRGGPRAPGCGSSPGLGLQQTSPGTVGHFRVSFLCETRGATRGRTLWAGGLCSPLSHPGLAAPRRGEFLVQPKRTRTPEWGHPGGPYLVPAPARPPVAPDQVSVSPISTVRTVHFPQSHGGEAGDKQGLQSSPQEEAGRSGAWLRAAWATGDPVREGRGGNKGRAEGSIRWLREQHWGPLSPLGSHRASGCFLGGKPNGRVAGKGGGQILVENGDWGSLSATAVLEPERLRVLAPACGRAAPGAAANKRVFAQRAAQSDADSMETWGLRGSIGRSCRGAAPGSCHRRSQHRPGRCRDLGVPRVPWVSP